MADNKIYTKEQLEGFAKSSNAEERKILVMILRDTMGQKMSDVVRLSADDRIAAILEFYKKSGKTAGKAAVPAKGAVTALKGKAAAKKEPEPEEEEEQEQEVAAEGGVSAEALAEVLEPLSAQLTEVVASNVRVEVMLKMVLSLNGIEESDIEEAVAASGN